VPRSRVHATVHDTDCARCRPSETSTTMSDDGICRRRRSDNRHQARPAGVVRFPIIASTLTAWTTACTSVAKHKGVAKVVAIVPGTGASGAPAPSLSRPSSRRELEAQHAQDPYAVAAASPDADLPRLARAAEVLRGNGSCRCVFAGRLG
jgi:hypothetical protein